MVEYKDKIIICIDCQNEFIFTIEKQEIYNKYGFTNKLKRCRSCTIKKVTEKRTDYSS